MSDLIKRLRYIARYPTKANGSICHEAANALEQSQGREEQAFIAGIAVVINNMDVNEEQAWQQYLENNKGDFREARGILKSTEDSG